MNKELTEVIKLYATKSHKDLNDYLLNKSKNTLIAILTDLLTTSILKARWGIMDISKVFMENYKQQRRLIYEGKIGKT
jgi:hypothetical protein